MKKAILFCALMILPLLQGCYYGPGWHYGHGWGHGGWGHGGHWHAMDIKSVASGDVAADAKALAADYQIRENSAAQIMRFAQGNVSSQTVAELNLSVSDLNAISELQMPSAAGLHKIAAYLGEEFSKVEAIAADFFKAADAQVGDINSPYWTSCMSAGRWKTPQNQNCQQTYWQGCSPAMGATACESMAQSE